MARPVNADGVATRRRVLSAAAALFSEHGVDGTSIRDVAREAHVSLAMVHHYFGSKDGLYRSSIASMYEELEALTAELEPTFLGPAPFEERLESVVRAGFRFARAHRPAVQLLVRSAIDTGELDAHWQRERHLPFLDRAALVLGELLGRPAEPLRLAIQSLVHLAVRYALSSPRELALVTGLLDDPARRATREQEERAVRRVEDHLVATARALVAPAREG